MTEGQEKKEFVHWQDLAKELGAEPIDDINDYFGGMAKFAGEPIEDDGLDVPSETIAVGVEEETAPPAVATEPALNEPASDSEELVIDWGSDSPTQEAVSDKPTRKPKKSRKSDDDKKSAKSKKRKPKKERPPVEEETVAEVEGPSHWDSLALSLGLDVPEPPVVEAAQDTDEKIKPTEEAAAVAEDDSLSNQSAFETPSEDVDAGNEIAASETIQMAKSMFGEPEGDDSMAILDQMFVPPDEPFNEVAETESSADYEDASDDELQEEDANNDDELYVEFEVQSLGGESRPKREPRRNREKQSEKRPRGRAAKQEEETENSEDDEVKPARSRRGQRSRRPERADGPNRRRNRRSDDADVAESSGVDDDRDDSDDDDGRRKKPKKHPTWRETIESIIDTNLAGRKKPTKRRGRKRN